VPRTFRPQVWNEHACVKVAWDFVRVSRFRQYSALSAPAMTQVVRILAARPDVTNGRVAPDWASFPAIFVDILHWCYLNRMDKSDQKRAKVREPCIPGGKPELTVSHQLLLLLMQEAEVKGAGAGAKKAKK